MSYKNEDFFPVSGEALAQALDQPHRVLGIAGVVVFDVVFWRGEERRVRSALIGCGGVA